jgi:hypothetical protein
MLQGGKLRSEYSAKAQRLSNSCLLWTGVFKSLLTIWREAAAKPATLALPDIPHPLILLPLRARSQASQLPRPPGRIKSWLNVVW